MSNNEWLVIVIVVFALIFYAVWSVTYKNFPFGCGFALGGFDEASEVERKRALVPYSEISEEDKRKQKLRSIPFFCAAILFVVLTIADFGSFPFFSFYAVMMLHLGFLVRRYRRSYYVRKGKILRNIADLLIYVVFLGYTIAVFFIPDDYEYDYVVSGSPLVVYIIVWILQSMMRKCEVEK